MQLRFGVTKPYWQTMKAPHWPNFDWLISHDLGDLDSSYQNDVKCRHNHCPSYHPSMRLAARHVFPGMEKITTSYSQSMQDIFVLTFLNGKLNGTYIELGAFDPINFNNTYLLSQFGWNGLSIDILESLSREWELKRPNNTFIAQDALKIDYKKLLNQHALPTQIDYLQIDIDHPDQNLLLETLLQSGHRFSVITNEHNVYDGPTGEDLKNNSVDLLLSHGYVRLVENITCFNFLTDSHVAFEVWWIDPNVITTVMQQKFLTVGKNKVYPFELFCNENSVEHLMEAVLLQKNIWN